MKLTTGFLKSLFLVYWLDVVLFALYVLTIVVAYWVVWGLL